MLIDIDKYAIMAMDRLEASGFYSEIDPAELLESIRKSLDAIYSEKITVLSLKLDLEQARDLPISSNKYKAEYANIRRELMDYANEISMTEIPKVTALTES